MRQGPNGRRPRGRPNRKQHGGPSRPNSFDSSGPEGRIRGNAHQVYEKYVALARDAISAGDRVSAETYYQHAEHYFRIVNSSTDPETTDRRPARHDGNGRDFGDRSAGGRGPHGQAEPTPGTAEAGPGLTAEPGAPGAGDGESPDNAPQSRQAPQSAQPAPRRAPEDREGLDRVLGQEGAPPRRRGPRRPQSPDQVSADGRSDRDSASAATPRRPRQSSVRAQDGGANAEAAERPTRRPGNGQDQAGAPAPDSATPSEPAEASAPGEKNPDSEPAGA